MKLYGKNYVGTVGYLGGIPFVHEEFCWAWGNFVEFNRQYLLKGNEEIFYNKGTVSYHSIARNQLVEQIQGDWLFSTDTDHRLEPDVLCRLIFLMNKYNVDAISGIYQFKVPPYPPNIYLMDEKDGMFEIIGNWEKESEIIKVDAAGGGCMLVRRSVFVRIVKELGEMPYEPLPMPNAGGRCYSEDISFCVRLKRLGINLWCAPKVQHPHFINKALTLDDYQFQNLSMVKNKVGVGFK